MYFSAALKKIGSRAFEECAIVSLSLPESVVSLGDYVFCHCYWLNTFLFPNHRVSLGTAVFSGCAGLEVLVIADRGMRRWRKRELLHIPYDTQLIYHRELHLALLLSELGEERITEERRRTICQEIRRQSKQLNRRISEKSPMNQL